MLALKLALPTLSRYLILYFLFVHISLFDGTKKVNIVEDGNLRLELL